MTDFPREMMMNDEVSATEWNRLVRAIRRIAPRQGPGILLDETPNGTFLSAAPAAQGRAAAPAAQPWTFVVGTSQSGRVKGEWTRAVVQFGYDMYSLSDLNAWPHPGALPGPSGGDVSPGTLSAFTGDDLDELAAEAEGYHYLKANLMTGEMEIEVVELSAHNRPANDLANSIVYIYVGTVEAEKDEDSGDVTALRQTAGIHSIPTLYRYVTQ